jgi:hypothetical protein
LFLQSVGFQFKNYFFAKMNRGSDGEVSGSQVKSVMMNTFFKSKKNGRSAKVIKLSFVGDVFKVQDLQR